MLRRCLRECASALGHIEDPARDEDLFERALVLNREQSDYAVRPLAARLQELFGADAPLDEASARALGTALDKVDATVFCMDVGWREPHHAPFDRALSLLDVAPADALFVGDDHRWDIVGAQNAGLRPVLLESVAPKVRRECLTIPNLADIIAL